LGMEMGISISLESVIINTVAGRLMDLEKKPDITYGDKARIIYDLIRNFDRSGDGIKARIA